jgi:hypothetical protein
MSSNAVHVDVEFMVRWFLDHNDLFGIHTEATLSVPRKEGVSLLDSNPKEVHLIDSTDKALNNLRGCST